ncbi:hypothetical protein [Streptomyces sp. NPDC002580]|uniref:hypothetical protein n=1 Tax=Streptomyces sp. NPDC002580 TaxID=3364653 RepID=UPI0036C45037
MSQSTPPSGPPVDDTLAAPDAPAPSDRPPIPRRAFAQSAPRAGFRGAPVAPAAPARGDFALGLAAAVGAGLVSAVLYAIVIGLTKHEFVYAAIGVGILVGIATGRVGGRSETLPVVSVIVAVAATYLGQLAGKAMLIAKEVGVGFDEVFFDHIDVAQAAWKADARLSTFVFFGFAAYMAFQCARTATR